jgi:hypothetical protein
MGHCGEFGCTQWATAANLVLRYGPLRRIWLCAAGLCGRFGYRLRATARNKALQLKSVTISVLWAITQDLIMRYGP